MISHAPSDTVYCPLICKEPSALTGLAEKPRDRQLQARAARAATGSENHGKQGLLLADHRGATKHAMRCRLYPGGGQVEANHTFTAGTWYFRSGRFSIGIFGNSFPTC